MIVEKMTESLKRINMFDENFGQTRVFRIVLSYNAHSISKIR